MRQIGTIADEAGARKLADYLLTQKIETHLAAEDAGWAVWVIDEDALPRARQELASFLSNPQDTRYAAAAEAARALRQKEEREDRAFERRQVDLGQRWAPSGPGRPVLTLVLALASLGVSVASGTVFVGLTERKLDPDNKILNAVLIKSEVDPGPHPLGLGQVLRGQIWRLVTPIFLHFGPLHLLFNLWMLRYLGALVEMRRGTPRMLMLVLAIAVLSNVAQYFLGGMKIEDGRLVLAPNPLFGGMSGVLYGLSGYAWMKGRFAPELGIFLDPTLIFMMLAWFVFCLLGVIGSVANVAHGVGLLMGIAIGIAPHVFRRRSI